MYHKLYPNLILIGFMGSGKTTIGERLAGCLNYQFQDTDKLIEEQLRDTIAHVFRDKGEEYFRGLETKLLEELKPSLHHTVLSTGGGIILRQENRSLLKELGYVIYLKTSASSIIKRLANDQSRPLLSGDDPASKVEKLLKYREPIYEEAAQSIIVTDNRTHEEVTQRILEVYQQVRRQD